jgi:hypothetical protein
MNGVGQTSAFKVDPTRGQQISRVSSEWFSRPADERYLDLDTLFEAVSRRAECSRTRTVESREIRVQAWPDEADALAVILPGRDMALVPTHWAFGQLCSLVGAPAGYLRDMPETLAGINLQYGLSRHRSEQIKTLEMDDGRLELRAATGPEYGRYLNSQAVSPTLH